MSYCQIISINDTDSLFVKKALIKNDPQSAKFNTIQIEKIMSKVPKGATMYFPAGDYYFDGAAIPNHGTIESTNPGQIFRGDGVGTTRIIQKNKLKDFGFSYRKDLKRVPTSTFRIRHKGSRIENLTIILAEDGAESTIAGSAAISIAHIVYFKDNNIGIVETTGDESTGNFLLDHVIVSNVDIGENNTGGIMANKFFEVGIDIQGSGGHVRISNINRLDAKTGIRLDNGNHCGQGEYQFESVYSMGNPAVFKDGVFFDWVGGQAPSIHNSSASFTSGIFAGPRGKFNDRLNPYPEAIVMRRSNSDWDWFTVHNHHVVDLPDQNQRSEWYGLPRYSEIIRVGNQPRAGGKEWMVGEDFEVEIIDKGVYEGASKIVWKGERPDASTSYFVTYKQPAEYRVHDLEWGNTINFSSQEANQVGGFAVKFDDQGVGFLNPDFRYGIGYNFIFSSNFVINGNFIFNGHIDNVNISGLTSGVCNIVLNGVDNNRNITRVSVNNSTFNYLKIGEFVSSIRGVNNFMDNSYQIFHEEGNNIKETILKEWDIILESPSKVEFLPIKRYGAE